ncbi:MAG: hypothetical protein K2X55_17970 [Burkholderiaceae bacterium]|nr:hypothetical protein [Burkholderiaceae bacterium]
MKADLQHKTDSLRRLTSKKSVLILATVLLGLFVALATWAWVINYNPAHTTITRSKGAKIFSEIKKQNSDVKKSLSGAQSPDSSTLESWTDYWNQVPRIPLGSKGVEYVTLRQSDVSWTCDVNWDQQGCEVTSIQPEAATQPMLVFLDGYFRRKPKIAQKKSGIIAPQPMVEIPAGTKFEYCRYNLVQVSKRGDAEWRITHARPDSIGVKLTAYGSQKFFDRWGSKVEVSLNDVVVISLPNTPEQRTEAGCTDQWSTSNSSGKHTETICVAIPGGGGLGTQICTDKEWRDGRWTASNPYHCGTCISADF